MFSEVDLTNHERKWYEYYRKEGYSKADALRLIKIANGVGERRRECKLPDEPADNSDF